MHAPTPRISLRTAALAITLALVSGSSLGAQRSTASSQPLFKGVLEPVSYTEDLDLTQVFFVTADVGWVAGKSGTILRTVDGGNTWEAQLGGDPADRSDAVGVLHFLDERRGWAVQGMKTLHTRDGESWEEIGSAPYGVQDMAFTSPSTGFVAGSPQATHLGPGNMYRTTDGGRTWKPVWTCQAKVAMGGLTRNLDCSIGQIQFPTAQVGYAVVSNRCVGMGCGGPPLIAKTMNGGDTWQVLIGPGVIEQDQVTGLSFLDENTGFARLGSKKLHMTTDGGQTWRGIVASPGADIQFADPFVGWGIELRRTDLRLTYTTDGGKRWSSREMKLPAVTRAFSLPRRDRGYVVGDHGMIFRYRVVPAADALGPNAIAAPAMPGFESPVDEELFQLEEIVQEMAAEFSTAPTDAQPAEAAAGAARAIDPDSASAADSAAAWNEPFEAPLPPPTGFTADCCKKSFNRLEAVLGALSQSLPQFIGQYRNLNLFLASIRMSAELPGQYRTLKGGLRTFRRAKDKESAQSALAGVMDALSAFRQTTLVSMQQQLPPPVGSDEPFQSSFSASGGGPPAAPTSAVSPPKEPVLKDAADKAKKGLGSLLRKKKPQLD